MSGGFMDEWKVRILHISDLHERGPREPEPFRRRRVLGDAWKRNLDALLEDGAIDLVCFTGDVADWGQASEYGPATDFIEALLQQLSLPIDRLFLVPGNHDIDRNKGLNAWAELRGGKDAAGQERKGKLSRGVRPLDLSRWMAGGNPPLGLENVSREELLSRQGAYREWVGTRLGRPELLPSKKAPHPHLGYRQTIRLSGHPFDIHVVGLDSAWLAGDDNDKGNLLLTTNQVGQLTTHGGEPLPGFRLALIHHPLSDLADKDDSQRLLADRMDLLLRGHLHNEAVETWEDPDRTSRQLAAGCLYEGHEGDEWPNACHVIEARLDKEGRPIRYDLRFRSWAKRGHWYNDNSLYEGTQDGLLSWKIRPSPPPPPVPRTGSFVGRERELEKLKTALRPAERRPVAICAVHGMPGVGKSYLAARFAELHSEDFPGGCVRLVLNPTALPSVEVLLGELGTQLEVPAGARLAERCRERLLRPLTLLILENIDSRDAADVTVRFASLLQNCPLLMTGRFQGFSEEGGWTRIEVETPDEKTALQLLEQEVRPASDEHEKERYRHLVRTLGHLPLALHLAAGYLRAGHSAESFLEHLRTQGFNLEPVFRNDSLFSEDQARAIIRSTFELSLELLRQQLGAGAKAERLLSGFAAFGHAPLSGFGRSLGAAIAGISESEFGELIASASLLSLLARVPHERRKDDAWRVHPLLAELLRETLGSEQGMIRMTEWFIQRLRPQLSEQEQRERWAEIIRETNALGDWLLRVPEKYHVRVERIGSQFATYQGPFPAWMDFCERALRSPLSFNDRSNFLWLLANVAMGAGALDRVLSAAQEKEALDQERQAPREAALAVGIRADVLSTWGELDDALRIRMEEELPVYKGLGDTRAYAATLGKVAGILQARGDLNEALRILLEDVIPAFDSIGDVRSRAVMLGRVADLLQAQGKPTPALGILRQEVLPVFDHLGDVYSRAGTLVKVADLLHEQGRTGESMSILREEVLPVYERLGDVREQAVARGKIADILQSEGKFDEAFHILKQDVIPAFARLGAVRELAVAQGKVADILQARDMLDEALRIRREEEIPVLERLGAVRERAMALGKISDALFFRGELDEALRLLKEEELPVFENLGDVSARAKILGRIADIFHAKGKLDEALQLLREQVLPTFERLGEVRSRAVAQGKVADIIQAQGNLDEALRIRREEELPVFKRLGDMREYAVTLGKVAKILHVKGHSAEALQLLQEEVLPIFERMGAVREREWTLRQITKIRSGG